MFFKSIRNLLKGNNFPLELDHEYYLNRYSDLWYMNSNQDLLANHYYNFGIKEGRIPNHIHDKYDFINLIKSNNILEIGPFFNPLIKNAKFADYYSRDELIDKAKKENLEIDTNRIPNISYNLSHISLLDIDKKFDFIVSSHNIEHQPNLITHLQHVEHLLSRNGYYFLIIPDKRYIFDHFFTTSKLSEIVDAYNKNLTKHPFKKILMHKFLTTHNDSAQHWKGSNGEKKFYNLPKRLIRNLYKESLNKYIDVHSWFFTPSSFSSIITELFNKKYTSLQIERVYSTRFGSCEFFVILKKN